jgi:hypothetical protein
MPMLSRWSVLFLVVGVVAGYVLAGPSAKAQGAPVPFQLGDRVILTYINDKSASCVIGEIHGNYLRCDSANQNVSIGTRRQQRWQSLESIVSIMKSED